MTFSERYRSIRWLKLTVLSGIAAGMVVNALLFLFVYVWPWSVLIGCEQSK